VRGLVVGRFQPFHRGHLGLLEGILARRPDEPVLLGIGSAQESYTRANPFTAGERFAMIERAAQEAKLDGCRPVPIPDIDRHAMWVGYLESLLPPFDHVYTNNPLTKLLFERAEYAVETPPLIERGRFEGAAIRRRIENREPWEELVPPAVAACIRECDGEERIRLLASTPGIAAHRP
jgi:nicotinamide-nucleotide adenylyltransferase